MDQTSPFSDTAMVWLPLQIFGNPCKLWTPQPAMPLNCLQKPTMSPNARYRIASTGGLAISSFDGQQCGKVMLLQIWPASIETSKNEQLPLEMLGSITHQQPSEYHPKSTKQAFLLTFSWWPCLQSSLVLMHKQKRISNTTTSGRSSPNLYPELWSAALQPVQCVLHLQRSEDGGNAWQIRQRSANPAQPALHAPGSAPPTDCFCETAIVE